MGVNQVYFLEQFRVRRAVVENGHFVYASGRHGTVYLNKRRLYFYPVLWHQVCRDLSLAFRDDHTISAVVGPELGGIPLSCGTAYEMAGANQDGNMISVYAYKREDGKGFYFDADALELLKGRKVLLVEDILNTGGSIKKVIKLLLAAGVQPVAVSAIWNRGRVTAEMLGVESLVSIIDQYVPSYSPEDCPACKDGVLISPMPGRSIAA